jgi:hypothetical protein
MTIQEFRDYMASGKPVVGGSEVHMMSPSAMVLLLQPVPS